MSVVTSEDRHPAEVNTVRPAHTVEAVSRREAGSLGHAECLHRGGVAEILVRMQPVSGVAVMEPELTRLGRIPAHSPVHSDLPVMRRHSVVTITAPVMGRHSVVSITAPVMSSITAHWEVTPDSGGHWEAAESLSEAGSAGAEVPEASVILRVMVMTSSPAARDVPEYHGGEALRLPVNTLPATLHSQDHDIFLTSPCPTLNSHTRHNDQLSPHSLSSQC